MILQVFVIYDSKAHAYLPPWFAPNLELGVRDFAGAVNDPSTRFYRHSEDFTLFHLGSFDDAVGRVEQFPEQVNLGLAANFKKGIA